MPLGILITSIITLSVIIWAESAIKNNIYMYTGKLMEKSIDEDYRFWTTHCYYGTGSYESKLIYCVFKDRLKFLLLKLSEG